MGRRGSKIQREIEAEPENSETGQTEIAVLQSDAQPPIPLKGEALEIWRDTYSILKGAKILTAADLRALARYCIYFAEWLTLQEFQAESGYYKTAISSKGVEYLVKHPEISRSEFLENAITRLEKDLCLTPGSRGASQNASAGIPKAKSAFRSQLYGRSR